MFFGEMFFSNCGKLSGKELIMLTILRRCYGCHDDFIDDSSIIDSQALNLRVTIKNSLLLMVSSYNLDKFECVWQLSNREDFSNYMVHISTS